MPNPLQVEYRPVADLVPYIRNPRTHSDAQVALIAGSIQTFGFLEPVLVDGENGLIAGHGRVLAARKLRMETVPVLEIRHLDENARRAYVIAANQLAARAGWDDALLRLEIGALAEAGFELPVLGFETADLDRLMAPPPTDGLTDPDDAPEPPNEPVSKPGDVWLLGRHRLVCGDCTDAAVVALALKGVIPHLMVTDPPYGVDYDPEWRSKKLKDGAKRAEGAVSNDGRADWREAWALFPGDVAYVWSGDRGILDAGSSLVACDFQLRTQIVWSKPRFALGRGDYHHQHESCWYAVRKGNGGHWQGDRSQSTVWPIEARNSRNVSAADHHTNHSTQKPVECMQRPIQNNSSPGQAVYDPFVGAGTTIIAAERTGRACHAIDLDPAYVDVALMRWQAFTGKNATLDGTDKTFTQITAERRPDLVLKLGKPLAEKEAKRKR